MRDKVTPDDIETTVAAAAALLGGVSDERSWQRAAGDLEWTCWETVDHMSDDLFAYAAQLSGVPLAVRQYLPFVVEPRRPGGPALTIATEADGGVDGLLANLATCGAFLSSMTRTASPDVRGFHIFGVADAEGFAAMGIVEVLIHTYDVVSAFDLAWTPPGELCGRILARLFPDVDAVASGADEWSTLLWACGRIALPGAARRERWRWYGEPISE